MYTKQLGKYQILTIFSTLEKILNLQQNLRIILPTMPFACYCTTIELGVILSCNLTWLDPNMTSHRLGSRLLKTNTTRLGNKPNNFWLYIHLTGLRKALVIKTWLLLTFSFLHAWQNISKSFSPATSLSLLINLFHKIVNHSTYMHYNLSPSMHSVSVFTQSLQVAPNCRHTRKIS